MVKMSKVILKRLNAITAKRPRTVIQHILKHGAITTQDLTERYGYDHPPRAIRDVRELGIPIVTERVKDEQGRNIASYHFGDLSKWTSPVTKSAGRTALAKALKNALVEKYGARCAIYLEPMDAAVLQVDHRVPYEIGGEKSNDAIDGFMLLCPSANRAKSWTCEHCENWLRRDPAFCLRCFWASPDDYDHVAGQCQKVVNVVFTGDEIEDYRKLIKLSGVEAAQQTIKAILHRHLS